MLTPVQYSGLTTLSNMDPVIFNMDILIFPAIDTPAKNRAE